MNMKILVVDSMVIGDQNATGKTLDNLLNNIPDCELLEYCLDYDSSYHTPTVKVIYENKRSNIVFFIFKQIYRSIFHTKEKPGEIKRGITSVQSSSKKDPIKKKIIVALICLLDSIKHHVSKEDMKKIREYNPDILYLNGGTITTMAMAYYLSIQLNIPVVFHMMDNWYDAKYCGSILTHFGRKRLVKLTRLLHERSVINIAIGSKMAKYYSHKFKKEYRYAMNCVDNVYPSNAPENEPLKLIFSGGVHGGRIDSLRKMDEIITAFNQKNQLAQLYIYTSSIEKNKYDKQFGKYTIIEEYVPRDKMFSNLASADILVHVESFDDANIEFFRYSMSTKIPEYLSVGRPILCYGPKDIATVSYIKNEHVGLVAQNTNELSDQIVELIENRSLRNELGKNAIKVAMINHLTSEVVLTMRNCFDQAVNEWQLKESNSR